MPRDAKQCQGIPRDVSVKSCDVNKRANGSMEKVGRKFIF